MAPVTETRAVPIAARERMPRFPIREPPNRSECPIIMKSMKALSLLAIAATLACAAATAAAGPIPAPAVDAPLAAASGREAAVVSGGCFWGVQAVFQHVRGVIEATAGYAGGNAATAQYEDVSSGLTGHAESVEIAFDPSKVTYGQLLRVFFSVAHDPTELNRQGPDTGTQYRSMIFVETPEQARIARAYIAQLDAAHVFRSKIVTAVQPLPAFYRAEDYHQNYATLHPDDPYIAINDAPKVENLRKIFPDLYVSK
jgi:peptide-methionine (S)-S-oxide reductase